MKSSLTMVLVPFVLLAAAPWASASNSLNTAQIEKLTGLSGKLSSNGEVFKISYPRKDLKLKANGVVLTPALGLTAWAAFQRAGSEEMVMGDLVLTEPQVNPVMSAALQNGLEVTALHNHFFWDQPKIMFMHISGTGPESALASAVGKVFSRLKQTQGARPPKPVAIDPARTTLNPKLIERILGRKGMLSSGVYKVTIGRKASMHGHEIGSGMGVNTWAAFAGSDREAFVDGDFAMTESELQPVLKALRASGINIVAIHNHMTMETPRILFLHFWGTGSSVALARGVKAALDTQTAR